MDKFDKVISTLQNEIKRGMLSMADAVNSHEIEGVISKLKLKFSDDEFDKLKFEIEDALHGLNESYDKPKNGVHVLHIDGYTWYLEYIDSTHFYMSMDPKRNGEPYHIGQHQGKEYYKEVKSWLNDITSAKKESVTEGQTQELYIVSLYPYDDVYQVIDDGSVVFQGSQDDCKKYKRNITSAKKESVTEGQTQVYTAGTRLPQYGSGVNSNLMTLTGEFLKSKKSPAQVVAILVGMGYAQNLAEAAVDAVLPSIEVLGMNESFKKGDNVIISNYRKYDSLAKNDTAKGVVMRASDKVIDIKVGTGSTHADPQDVKLDEIESNESINESIKNQKNKNTMKFNLTSLYEMVLTTTNELTEMSKDTSRVSISSANCISILESVKKQFPIKFNNQEDLTQISEEIEARVSPMLKFRIAKDLHRSLAVYEHLNPISDLRAFLQNTHNANRWSFRINEAVESLSNQNGSLYTNLKNDFTALLNENEAVIKTRFALVANSYPWSNECKAILNEMDSSEGNSITQEGAKVIKQFSPVSAVNETESLQFRLHGVDYILEGSQISSSKATDQLFRTVCSALELGSFMGESMVFYGQNNKVLEYDLNEGKITMGKADLTNHSSLEIFETLKSTNFFTFKEQWKANHICTLFENIGMICEFDNFLSLASTKFKDVFLTMIAVEEGVWINKVNPAMKINEMVFFDNATDALKETKEFIGYDATSFLSERLIAEENETAIIEKKRSELNEAITVFENKREDVKKAITEIGESSELSEALALIESEITKFEKELQATYTITEKKKFDADKFWAKHYKKMMKWVGDNEEIIPDLLSGMGLGPDDVNAEMDGSTKDLALSIVYQMGDESALLRLMNESVAFKNKSDLKKIQKDLVKWSADEVFALNDDLWGNSDDFSARDEWNDSKHDLDETDLFDMALEMMGDMGTTYKEFLDFKDIYK